MFNFVRNLENSYHHTPYVQFSPTSLADIKRLGNISHLGCQGAVLSCLWKREVPEALRVTHKDLLPSPCPLVPKSSPQPNLMLTKGRQPHGHSLLMATEININFYKGPV